MGDILLILSLLYVLKALLMSSLIPNAWGWIGFAAACGAFVWISHGYALEQNKLALETLFEGQNILTDVSLVVMVDLMLTLGFCQSVLNRNIGIPQRWGYRVLAFIPPVLIFPVLYYAQVNLFFTFVGVDFRLLTGLLCGAALVVLLGGTALVKRALPDTDLRIELTALVELFIFILAICCTIFHPSALMYTDNTPVDYINLALMLAVVLTLFAAGFTWSRIRPNLKRKKEK